MPLSFRDEDMKKGSNTDHTNEPEHAEAEMLMHLP